MQIVKIIGASLAAALLLGIIGGKIVGNYLQKVKSEDYKPVLNNKEKIISLVSVALGVALIVIGVVVVPNKETQEFPDGNSEMVQNDGEEGEISDSDDSNSDDNENADSDTTDSGSTDGEGDIIGSADGAAVVFG